MLFNRRARREGAEDATMFSASFAPSLRPCMFKVDILVLHLSRLRPILVEEKESVLGYEPVAKFLPSARIKIGD